MLAFAIPIIIINQVSFCNIAKKPQCHSLIANDLLCTVYLFLQKLFYGNRLIYIPKIDIHEYIN